MPDTTPDEPRLEHRRQDDPRTTGSASSFAKGLFLGDLHEEPVFPYPTMDGAERKRVDEEFGRIDATLATVMGVHQSIGVKGIRPVRQRRAEGAVPARPGRGAQAGGVRVDRAVGRLGRLPPGGPRVRRLVAPRRREALHRPGQPRRGGHVRQQRGRPRTLGVLAEYMVGRVQREVGRNGGVHRAHQALAGVADPVGDQVAHLRQVCEALLRRHGDDVAHRQWQLKRVAHAAMDLYAQVAVLSRTSALLDDRGVDTTGTERYIAETFCTRAAARVHRELDRVEDNDDDRMRAIARSAYDRDGYGFALYPG